MSTPVHNDGCDELREAIVLSGPRAEEDCEYHADTWRGMIERGACPDDYKAIRTFRPLIKCDQAGITIRLCPSGWMWSKSSLSNEELYRLAGKIIIHVRPRDKSAEILRLTMQLSEGATFFADGFPTTETYEAFCRKVRDRKRYPPAKVEIPCEGGKSLTAQGQTKKPGSHSHDKHK